MRKTLLLLAVAAMLAAPARAVETNEPAIFREDGLLFVVNKQHPMSGKYEPADLVKPNVQTRKVSLQRAISMREEAARQLEKMFYAADIEKGYRLFGVSGYRSYGIQQINFNSKRAAVGSKATAALTVAPPGTSEHQLGLVMDIQSSNFFGLTEKFGETAEGRWLMENAHRFGFILRYKKEWQDITGYIYEPWHYRYVGIAHARAVYALNLPLETYVEYAKRLPNYILEKGTDLLLTALIRGMMEGERADMALAAPMDEAAEEQSLRLLTEPYLPENMSYEQAVWRCFPEKKPPSPPRVDEDSEEVELFSGCTKSSHGVAA